MLSLPLFESLVVFKIISEAKCTHVEGFAKGKML